MDNSLWIERGLLIGPDSPLLPEPVSGLLGLQLPEQLRQQAGNGDNKTKS